ncbi:MAG TPA: outer membrane beta-barrel protein [Allosphingosinicella sp.]|nr:outer membrane beta-barrel protein [Allosphingosinicella sp.]
MIRRLIIGTALFAAASAGPAHARNGDFYIGADFGVMLPNDTSLTFTPGIGAGTTGTATLDYDRGFDGGVFAGYDLGIVRIEAEASYRSADVGEIASNGVIFPGTAGATAVREAGGGDVSALSFMGNAMLDFGNEDGLSFFVGGGAGYARVEINSLRAFANTGVILDDREWRFAWQGVAGIRQAVSNNVDVTIRYRYFNAGSAEFVGFGGRAVDASIRSHSLMGGITFNFW